MVGDVVIGQRAVVVFCAVQFGEQGGGVGEDFKDTDFDAQATLLPAADEECRRADDDPNDAQGNRQRRDGVFVVNEKLPEIFEKQQHGVEYTAV